MKDSGGEGVGVGVGVVNWRLKCIHMPNVNIWVPGHSGCGMEEQMEGWTDEWMGYGSSGTGGGPRLVTVGVRAW